MELLQEWCKNLRIDINTFMTIVEELRPAVTPSENSFRRDTISGEEKKLAMCLYYLKDKGSYLLQNPNLHMLFEFYIRLTSQLMLQSLPTSIVLLSPLYPA